MSNELLNQEDYMEKRYNRPIKLSDSLGFINKNHNHQFNKIEYIIHSKWPKIVGDFFVKYSQPEKIVNMYESSDDFEVKNHQKLLHVNVAPAAALEFQHFQNKIIEKINSFFGYEAVQNIKLVSFEEKNKEFKENQITNDVTKNKYKKQISDIKNEKIKESLIKFSKVYKKK